MIRLRHTLPFHCHKGDSFRHVWRIRPEYEEYGHICESCDKVKDIYDEDRRNYYAAQRQINALKAKGPEAVIKDCKKWLLKGKNGGHLQNWFVVLKDGDFARAREQPCFATFLSYRVDSDNPIEYFFESCIASYRGELRVKEETCLEYLDWVANHSFWSPYIKTKDPKMIMKEGTEFVVDEHPRLVISSAQVIRHVIEYPHTVTSWALFKKYCDEHIALIFACAGLPGLTKTRNYRMFNRWGGSHVFTSSEDFGPRELNNLLAGKTYLGENKKLSQTTNYRGVSSIWKEVKHKEVIHFSWADSVNLFCLDDLEKDVKMWIERNGINEPT